MRAFLSVTALLALAATVAAGGSHHIPDSHLEDEVERKGVRGSGHHGQNRKVNLHAATAEVNPKPDHITFDPLVQEVEMMRDDNKWEKEYEKKFHEHHHVHTGHGGPHDLTASPSEKAHEQLLHDAGVDNPEALTEKTVDALNLDERMDVIFPLIDVDPKDDHLSLAELSAWELQMSMNLADHRMDRELEVMDADGDDMVTFKEFMHDHSPEDRPLDMSKYSDEDRRYYELEKERFDIVDEDGDGKITREQLNKALHPEDSNNERLLEHLRKEELRLRDLDKDGRINADEFLQGVWNEVFEWDESTRVWADKYMVHPPPPRKDPTALEKKQMGLRKFKDLDTDGDRFLSLDEFKQVMHVIKPGDVEYAEQTAQHILEQADDDKDGYLTLEEMFRHEDTFYEVAKARDFPEAEMIEGEPHEEL